MEKYINLSQTLKYSQRKDYSDLTYLFSPSNLKMNNISSYYGKNFQTKQTANSNNNKLKYINLNQNFIQNSLKRTESINNNNLNFNLLSPNHNKILKELKNYLDSYKSNKNYSNNHLIKNMNKISSKKNLNISNNNGKINSKIINLSNSALHTKLRKKTSSPKNKIKLNYKTNNLNTKKQLNDYNSIRVNNNKEHYSSLRKNNRTNNIYNNKSSLYMSGDETSLKNNTTANTTNNFIIRKNSTNVNLSNNLNENEIFINISDLLNYNNNINQINYSDLFLEFYNFNNYTKETNSNKFSIVDSVVFNSYQNTKNDELKIICNLNVEKPQNFNENWPNNFSYFAILNGHCGKECSEFLSENLLNFITNNNFFPNQIEKAIEFAFAKIEEKFFLECFYDEEILINSGACVLISLIIDEFIYVANLGDSKLMISYNNCEYHKILTTTHNLENENEKKRVEKNGGKIYNEKININKYISNHNNIINNNNIFLIGPFRILPGNLTVTRTIGDFKAKINSNGEKMNIISSKPEIKKYKLKSNIDFICMGNDGIFNFIKDENVLTAFKILKKNKENKNILCDFVLKYALKNKSVCDLACVIIFLDKKKLNKIENNIKMFSNNYFKKKFKKKFHRKGSLDVDNFIMENESKYNNLNNKDIFVETEPYFEDDFELNKIINEKQITSSSHSKNKKLQNKIYKKENHSTLELKNKTKKK